MAPRQNSLQLIGYTLYEYIKDKWINIYIYILYALSEFNQIV